MIEKKTKLLLIIKMYKYLQIYFIQYNNTQLKWDSKKYVLHPLVCVMWVQRELFAFAQFNIVSAESGLGLPRSDPLAAERGRMT